MRRLSGDDNAPPVINLQTNFGGGKTHSMLALWHVAAAFRSANSRKRPRICCTANGYTGAKVNRVAIVGNHFSPSGVTSRTTAPTSTPSGVSWPGSSVAPGGYAMVAKADADRTRPVKPSTSCWPSTPRPSS